MEVDDKDVARKNAYRRKKELEQHMQNLAEKLAEGKQMEKMQEAFKAHCGGSWEGK